MNHILTIAGSDSCAGAGVQADLKTISALGAYGLCVLTSITAQNTQGVGAIQELEPWFIASQLDAIFSDIRVDAIKIGMLGSSAITQVVADYLAPKDIPIVLDPVMVAKSGDRLLEPSAIDTLKRKLLPLAAVITPNLPEAEELVKFPVKSLTDMERACHQLLQWGTSWVVIKGGHLDGEPVDVIGHGDEIYHLTGRRIEGNNNHGTGCTYSSAIATGIAMGYQIPEAVRRAKDYIEMALEYGFAIGSGVGVLNHFAPGK